jgi:hypothetical protein
MLVVWVALCMMNAAANRAHPLLRDYGVGVDWKNLRHLVLTDRPAVDAMLATAEYLREHTKEKSVFTLRDDGKATLELARRYGEQDFGMQQVWREEEAAAAERQAGHWAEVQRKKALLERTAQRQLEAAQAARDMHSRMSAGYINGNYAVNQANSVFTTARGKRYMTEREINVALVFPAPVCQPLPKSASTAAAWLFFLYMPPLLRQELLLLVVGWHGLAMFPIYHCNLQ